MHNYLNYLISLHVDSVLVLPVYRHVIFTCFCYSLFIYFSGHYFYVFLLSFSSICIVGKGPRSNNFTVSLHLLFRKHVTNKIGFDLISSFCVFLHTYVWYVVTYFPFQSVYPLSFRSSTVFRVSWSFVVVMVMYVPCGGSSSLRLTRECRAVTNHHCQRQHNTSRRRLRDTHYEHRDFTVTSQSHQAGLV